MRIFVIDNYDSFTYNLVQYLQDLGAEVVIKRNDRFELDEIASYDKLLISPGPGVPDDAGLTKKAIERYAGSMPVLGICLGLQAMVEVYGGELINQAEVHHGVSSNLTYQDEADLLFKGLDKPMQVGRYHSWIANENKMPGCLKITAAVGNEVMAVSHRELPLRGVQFHPESVLTPQGKMLLNNWLNE